MLRIHPIPQQQATGTIADIYHEIQTVFEIDTVPLFFQYLANYEAYLAFLWERMTLNIQSEIFHSISLDIRAFVAPKVAQFAQSKEITDFLTQLTSEEKEHMSQTIARLERLNIQMMLLTLDVRESMKSIAIDTQRVAAYSTYTTTPEADPFEQSKHHEESPISANNNMLAPLFGNAQPADEYYPDFFTLIAAKMEQTQNTELYLTHRVELEHQGLRAIGKFVQPLGCTYKEFRELTAHKPYVDDLLYVITDMFPSQFPNLVFTTAFMQHLLQQPIPALIQ